MSRTGPPPGWKKKSGARVPALMAARAKDACSADDLGRSDRHRSAPSPAGCGAAEERVVGGYADGKPALPWPQRRKCFALAPCRRRSAFAGDVLAGAQRIHGDWEMPGQAASR